MAEVRNPTSPTQHRPGTAPRSEAHEGVGESIRQTASGVAEAAGQMKEKVQDAASTVAHGVERAWESTSTGLRQGAHAVAETAENFWDDATGFIRRYPAACVLAAFGLGCLTAALLRTPRWTDDMTERMSRSSA